MKRLNKNKKPLILTLSIVAAVIIISYFALAYATKEAWPFAKTSQTNSLEDYSPPTEQEITDSQDGKKSLEDQKPTDSNSQNTAKPSSPQQSNAEVGISLVDVIGQNLEIRAFTSSVIDGSGTCTATVSKGTSTITRSSAAFIDTSTTQCGHISIPVSELSAGVWSVSIKFNSNSHNGTSEKVEVTIP